jgi:hypothetical protein
MVREMRPLMRILLVVLALLLSAIGTAAVLIRVAPVYRALSDDTWAQFFEFLGGHTQEGFADFQFIILATILFLTYAGIVSLVWRLAKRHPEPRPDS